MGLFSYCRGCSAVLSCTFEHLAEAGSGLNDKVAVCVCGISQVFVCAVLHCVFKAVERRVSGLCHGSASLCSARLDRQAAVCRQFEDPFLLRLSALVALQNCTVNFSPKLVVCKGQQVKALHV